MVFLTFFLVRFPLSTYGSNFNSLMIEQVGFDLYLLSNGFLNLDEKFTMMMGREVGLELIKSLKHGWCILIR